MQGFYVPYLKAMPECLLGKLKLQGDQAVVQRPYLLSRL